MPFPRACGSRYDGSSTTGGSDLCAVIRTGATDTCAKTGCSSILTRLAMTRHREGTEAVSDEPRELRWNLLRGGVLARLWVAAPCRMQPIHARGGPPSNGGPPRATFGRRCLGVEVAVAGT